MFNESNQLYNQPYNDQFHEKNCNNLKHLLDKNGVIYSTKWECSLRDRKGKIKEIKNTNKNKKS